MTKKIKNNMSSSGLTRRSRNKDLHADWMPDQVGHDRKEEQGRSMVEMLGTLAIIGVLSVGGIAGYTYAMNKYYANELLAGASERAVIVASQIASGRELSLSEFDKMKDTAGGTFDGTVKEFDDGIGIKVSGVKKAVCENLIKDTEGTDIGIETEAGGEVTCGDENTFFITFDSLGGVGAGCQSGEEYADDLCLEVSPCTNCKTCGLDANQVLSCDIPVDGCSTNSDCDEWCETNGGGEKCYCVIKADMTNDDNACWTNFVGNCAVANKKTGVSGDYIASTSRLSWWSAVNFCKAHNASLVSLANLDVTGGYQATASCQGNDCTGAFSWEDLKSTLGSGNYWVSDAVSCDMTTLECTTGGSNSSCGAYYVSTESSKVTNYYRYHSLLYPAALCK